MGFCIVTRVSRREIMGNVNVRFDADLRVACMCRPTTDVPYVVFDLDFESM